MGVFLTRDPDNSPDVHQYFWYNLTDDAQGRFTTEHNQLVVAPSVLGCRNPRLGQSDRCSSLNFEDQRSHVITVLVTDTGAPPLSAEFTLRVDVLDINDVPRDLTISNTLVFENMPEYTPIGWW